MPLISGSLSVWDISFRWAGYDPDKIYFFCPLEVKDNFRLIMEAILKGEIYCETLTLVKRPPDSKADPKYYIRTYIDDVYACIWGHRYNKKLLKWATISRGDFHEWCERRSIPLPEFWFPNAWKYDFEWPEYGTRAFWARHREPDEPGGFSLQFDIPDDLKRTDISIDSSSFDNENDLSIAKENHKARLVSQQIAIQLWKEYPDRTIAEMSQNEIILKYSGAANYRSALIKWLSEVAPVNIKGKRGRPRKKLDEA